MIKAGCILLFGTSFVCLWFTHSLSGLLGFVSSFVYLAFLFRKTFVSKKSMAITAGVIFTLVIFVGLNFSYLKNRIRDALVFSTNPESYKVSDPGLIRMGMWQGSIRMAFSDPKHIILGTGPETFPYQYPSFRENIVNFSSEWDFILNKPHNYYLEILTESGVLVLCVYLIIAVRSLILPIGIKPHAPFISAGLLGLYMSDIFGWPTVYTNFLFWIFLAFLSIKDTSQ